MPKLFILEMERKRAGLSQKEMAEKLNMSKTAYWYKENGQSDFNCTQMIALAKILNKSLDSLFMEDLEKQNEVFI